MSTWSIIDAVAVGLVLPWVIATYRLIAAFKQGVGGGLAKWAVWAAICIPAMLVVMWAVTSLR